MSDREKMRLRSAKRAWQSWQDTAGIVTLFLGCLTFCTVLVFLWAPGRQIASVVVGCMLLLVCSCLGLISSAAKVVQVRRVLKSSPARAGAEAVDALRNQHVPPSFN